MNCSASIKAKYVPRKNYESLINSRYCDRLWRYKNEEDILFCLQSIHGLVDKKDIKRERNLIRQAKS